MRCAKPEPPQAADNSASLTSLFHQNGCSPQPCHAQSFDAQALREFNSQKSFCLMKQSILRVQAPGQIRYANENTLERYESPHTMITSNIVSASPTCVGDRRSGPVSRPLCAVSHCSKLESACAGCRRSRHTRVRGESPPPGGHRHLC